MATALADLAVELVAEGGVSAASLLVGDERGILAEGRAGWVDHARRWPVARHHRFDLASLTKPWVATLALALDRRGMVPLGLPIGEVWPEAHRLLARQSLSNLLRHRSGLIAWRPFYRHLRSPRRVVERILAADSFGATRPTYSDPGYILWSRAAEALTGSSAASLLSRLVLRPLGVSTVAAAPLAASRCVASHLDNATERALAADLGVAVALRRGGPHRGVAQDGNARFLGGLAGHAGLLAPAHALWKLAAEWLRPRRVLTAASVELALAGRGRYRLGWWTPAAAPRATRPLSRASHGHHGFTGGSLWIDPAAGRVAVMLTHRERDAVDLDPWRRRFHHLAVV